MANQRAGLLSVPPASSQAAPLLPGSAGLLNAPIQPRTNYAQDGYVNPGGYEATPRPGQDISTVYDKDTGAPEDPMAYSGSLLGHDAQTTLKRQLDESTGGIDYAAQKRADLASLPPISQYGNASQYDAITAGAADRNAEHLADLERKITRDAPLYQAKAQERAAKNFIQSENIRFRNWTLRQQQKLQALQLAQALDGEKGALLGTILGVAGTVGGAIVGGPAGAAAGGAAGAGLGNAVGK